MDSRRSNTIPPVTHIPSARTNRPTTRSRLQKHHRRHHIRYYRPTRRRMDRTEQHGCPQGTATQPLHTHIHQPFGTKKRRTNHPYPLPIRQRPTALRNHARHLPVQHPRKNIQPPRPHHASILLQRHPIGYPRQSIHKYLERPLPTDKQQPQTNRQRPHPRQLRHLPIYTSTSRRKHPHMHGTKRTIPMQTRQQNNPSQRKQPPTQPQSSPKLRHPNSP